MKRKKESCVWERTMLDSMFVAMFRQKLYRGLYTTPSSLSAASKTRSLSYSRMIDFGGAPSGMHDNGRTPHINTSKNSKIQAICFDFYVLTRSIQEGKDTSSVMSTMESNEITTAPILGHFQPDLQRIQQVADLLNVDISETIPRKKESQLQEQNDDLSILTGPNPLIDGKATGMSREDVRAKYAAKLAQKGVDGGVSGVERARNQLDDKKGDAAGHFAARKMAASEPVLTGKRWMAVSGSGSLLQYLTLRSIKICLVPRPSQEINKEEQEEMEDFKKQLRDVVIDLLVKDGSQSVTNILKGTLDSLQIDPTRVLLVSDREDYMRAAKEAGMTVCHIRPSNARRGNFSPHYVVPSVAEVKNVVDEINGISFNAISKIR
jgi:beta-phosphoglucomutase-like phosphatase (HAD superfamily)